MSWKAKTIFYHQLAMLAKTGIQASEAVKLVADNSPEPYRSWAPRLLTCLDQGGTLAEGLRQQGEKPLVSALIEAGEKSGKLVQACKEVEAFYQLCVDMQRMAVSRLA